MSQTAPIKSKTVKYSISNTSDDLDYLGSQLENSKVAKLKVKSTKIIFHRKGVIHSHTGSHFMILKFD